MKSDSPLLFLELTDYQPNVVCYTEQMIQDHESDLIVRKLVLHLIERNADQYDSILEMPYFNWVVDRYGEGNLARKARLTFLQAKEK